MSEPYRIRLLDDLAGKRKGDIVTVPSDGITAEDGLHFLGRGQAEKISPVSSVSAEPAAEPAQAEAETPATPPTIASETAAAPSGETR